MSWRSMVLGGMRVPHEPSAPPGSPPRVFRAARNFLRLRIIRWLLGQSMLFAIAVGSTIFIWAVATKTNAPRLVVTGLQLIEILGWIGFVLQCAVSWALLRFDYELRWYMVSDRAIRIREGIATMREKTMTLANIQNISIKQGPLQRLLGIADVEVNSAGGGAVSADGKQHQMGEPMHVAYFRGVDNAEEIRELLRDGVRRQRNSGLGDHDEHEHHETHSDDALQAAIATLLDEAKQLRRAVN